MYYIYYYCIIRHYLLQNITSRALYRNFKPHHRILIQSYSSGNPHARLGFSDIRSFTSLTIIDMPIRNSYVCLYGKGQNCH